MWFLTCARNGILQVGTCVGKWVAICWNLVLGLYPGGDTVSKTERKQRVRARVRVRESAAERVCERGRERERERKRKRERERERRKWRNCNILQHTAKRLKILSFESSSGLAATHCNTLQHTTTHGNTLRNDSRL